MLLQPLVAQQVQQHWPGVRGVPLLWAPASATRKLLLRYCVPTLHVQLTAYAEKISIDCSAAPLLCCTWQPAVKVAAWCSGVP